MKRSQEELTELIIDSHTVLIKAVTEAHAQNYDVNDIYFAYYYTPNEKVVTQLIKEIELYVKKTKPTQAESKQAGYKLEELAFAAFYGLKGCCSPKSFQSAGPQYDLLITGEGPLWNVILSTLLPDANGATIVVEAKATKAPVSDQQFSRLCSIMETNMPKTSALGMFFTINGASGFPKVGKPKQRTVGAARLRQLLFYARTSKPIVVLTIEDIRYLAQNGSLLRILKRKIRDIEELTGLPTEPENIDEVVLPKNLKALREKL